MKRLFPLCVAALLSAVPASARAGMVATPVPREGTDREMEETLRGVLPRGIEDVPGGNFLETYQLVVLIATLVVAGIVLIAILGYGLFEKKSKRRLEDLD